MGLTVPSTQPLRSYKRAMKQPQVGRLIRELRLQMELTQEQFAAELGVVYPTVNRWENGHAQPSPLALKKIEEMLQIMGDRGQYLMAKHFGDRE